MMLYALLFITVNFTFIGDPSDLVVHHELESWKHPYMFHSLEECREIESAINKQQIRIDYISECVKLTKENTK